MLALTAVLGARWLYSQWRLGRIELSPAGEPVIAQVFAADSDTAISEPFDVASRAVIALPAGDYRLRVNGKGLMGRTYRFAVNRGETQAHRLSLDEGRLLGGEHVPAAAKLPNIKDMFEGKDAQDTSDKRIPSAPDMAALELTPGKANLLEWTKGSLICRDGATGRVLWDAFKSGGMTTSPKLPNPFGMSLPGSKPDRSRIVEHAPDLNGDGTGDVLVFAMVNTALIAISGKDGSSLWNYFVGPDGRAAPPECSSVISQAGAELDRG